MEDEEYDDYFGGEYEPELPEGLGNNLTQDEQDWLVASVWNGDNDWVGEMSADDDGIYITTSDGREVVYKRVVEEDRS